MSFQETYTFWMLLYMSIGFAIGYLGPRLYTAIKKRIDKKLQWF